MATSEIIQKEGLVLRLSDMKESDAMVKAIGPDGLFSFYARGVKKLDSKNGAATAVLALSSFTLTRSSAGALTLKEACAKELLYPSDQLTGLSIASFLLEAANSLVQEDEAAEAYPWLLGALKAIKEGKEPFAAGLICFAHILAIGGIGLDVDECVLCGGKKKIVALSYQDGGYVCQDCFDPAYMEKTPDLHLKMLRYIFKAPVGDYGRVSFAPGDCRPLYARLGEYVEEMTGTHLRSLDFLMKI